MKLISVVTPCFNEEENIGEVYKQVKKVFEGLSKYTYEHIFIDNNSQDETVSILKDIAAKDTNVKIIVNSRNFGFIRSPFYGLLQSSGDAATILSADLQDPPALLVDFLEKWEKGFRIVIAVKKKSKFPDVMRAIKNIFYNIMKNMSEIDFIRNFSGYGLYDKSVIEALRKYDECYPNVRSLICEIGFKKAEVEYLKSARKKGRTKNNLYFLFDMSMLNITNSSKVPLRIVTLLGFIISLISIFVAFVYFVYKLIYWDNFGFGMAPLVMGLFFFSSMQLFFIGIVGEYIGLIYTQVFKRPLVIEKERINFDNN